MKFEKTMYGIPAVTPEMIREIQAQQAAEQAARKAQEEAVRKAQEKATQPKDLYSRFKRFLNGS